MYARLLLRALLALGLVLPLGLAIAAPAQARETITICHATSSNKNPYNTQNPAANADVGGHAGHTGPIYSPGASNWGDIIPPIPGVFPGQNYDAYGQAILARDCKMPNEAPQLWVSPAAACLVYDTPGDTYHMLYSYTNEAPVSVTIPYGPANSLTPSSSAAPTTFSPGTVSQAFTVSASGAGAGPSTVLSSWTLGTTTASFTPTSSSCGPDIVVPGSGNGTGWIVVGLLSVLVLGLPILWYQHRIATQNRNRIESGY